MKNIKMTIICLSLIALMAFAATATTASAALINSNGLTARGSSTLAPVSQDAGATDKFPTHLANLGIGYDTSFAITTLTGGSGNAFKGVYNTDGTPADVGQMSRNPKVSEWGMSGAENVQLWAVGSDSIAIVISSGNSFLKQDLTAAEVADIYCNASYTNWDDLPANYLVSAAPAVEITRIIRPESSGTFECFDNFFLSLNGYAPADIQSHITLTDNADVYEYMTINSNRDYAIGFIGMGFMEIGGLVGINIYNADTLQYHAPTKTNVINGVYKAVRTLWEVTDGIPTTTSDDYVKSIWVSYLRLPTNYNSTASLLESNGYIPVNRADMAGGQVLDAELQPYITAAGQTQQYPDGAVDFEDIIYFVQSYLRFYSDNELNPYANMNADATVDFNDILLFIQSYIAYYS
ncbi:MAG: substrate-binding domain-containing protein [Candidatus Bathyarchaeota archaeon]|nr:substrate-binding domain-containing protein [Candidatus Bathyarchaeota archaeon]